MEDNFLLKIIATIISCLFVIYVIASLVAFWRQEKQRQKRWRKDFLFEHKVKDKEILEFFEQEEQKQDKKNG